MEQRLATLGAHRLQRVRDLDFRRPMKFTRDQLRVIERAQDGFCRSASSRLSAELRSEATLRFVTSDQLSYSAVMSEEMPAQSLVLMLRTEPLQTPLVLIVSNDAALRLVSRSLGGMINDDQHRDTLTELEISVAVRALSGLVDSMSTTWDGMCGQTLALTGTETSPVAVQVALPSEPTLMLSFSLHFDDHESAMTLVVPWGSVEALMDRIARSQDDNTVAGVATSRALGRAAVRLAAESGSRAMPVEELLSYGPGDTIVFDQREADGVVLRVEDQAVYAARHGAYEGSRAVQIIRRLDE